MAFQEHAAAAPTSLRPPAMDDSSAAAEPGAVKDDAGAETAAPQTTDIATQTLDDAVLRDSDEEEEKLPVIANLLHSWRAARKAIEAVRCEAALGPALTHTPH